MKIPELYLNQLRAAGLLLTEPFVASHRTMPSGIRVAKPAAVRGNGLPERARTWGSFGKVLVDTPLLYFFCRDGKWYVENHEFIPGPGPGDFRDEWCTAEEAVSDILAFFFGDATRMNATSRESVRAARRKSAEEHLLKSATEPSVDRASAPMIAVPWHAPHPRQEMCVFRSADQMAHVWRGQGGEDAKMPKVDFGIAMVIAVFEAQGTYAVARVIARVIPKPGAIYVIVEERSAPWNMINPRSVVSVPRMEGEVVFVQSGTPEEEILLAGADEA